MAEWTPPADAEQVDTNEGWTPPADAVEEESEKKKSTQSSGILFGIGDKVSSLSNSDSSTSKSEDGVSDSGEYKYDPAAEQQKLKAEQIEVPRATQWGEKYTSTHKKEKVDKLKSFIKQDILESKIPSTKEGIDAYSQKLKDNGYSDAEVSEVKSHAENVASVAPQLKEADAAIKQNPNNPEAYYIAGDSYLKMNDPEMAFNAYKQVLNLPPMETPQQVQGEANPVRVAASRSNAMTGMGHALQLMGRTEEAAKIYEQAYSADETNSIALRGLAPILYNAGEPEKAKQLLEKAKEIEQPKEVFESIEAEDRYRREHENDASRQMATIADGLTGVIAGFVPIEAVEGGIRGGIETLKGAIANGMGGRGITGSLQAAQGIAQIGLGAMMATPEGAIFNLGMNVADQVLPEDLNKFLMAPISTSLEYMDIKPNEAGAAVSSIGDIIAQAFMIKGLHGDAKAKEFGERLKKNEPIKRDEWNNFLETASGITDAEIKEAVAKVKEEKPIDKTAEGLVAKLDGLHKAVEEAKSPEGKAALEQSIVETQKQLEEHTGTILDEQHKLGVDVAKNEEINKQIESLQSDVDNAKASGNTVAVEALNKSIEELKTNLKENAVQESRTGEVLQREQGETGEAGSERTGVEPIEQGTEAPKEGEVEPTYEVRETPKEQVRAPKEFVRNEPAAKRIEDLPDEDYVRKFINSGQFDSIGTQGVRIDFADMSPAEVKQGLKDIKNGVESVPSKRLKANILRTKERGTVPMIEGVGGQSRDQAHDYDLAMFHDMINAASTDFNAEKFEHEGKEFTVTRDKEGNIVDITDDKGNSVNGNKNITPFAQLVEEANDNRKYGIKNADTKALNKEYGYKPEDTTKEQKRDLAEVNRRAKESGLSADTIIDTTHETKRPMTAEEQVVVLDYIIRKGKELKEEAARLMKAVEDGDEVARKAAHDTSLAITDQIKRANDSFQISGYEQGLAFRVRQMMKHEDYSVAESMRRYIVASKGEPVPHAIQKMFNELSDKIEELTKKNEEIEAEKSKAEVELATERLKEREKSPWEQRRKVERKAKVDKMSAAIAEMKRKIKSGTYSSLIPPGILTGALDAFELAMKGGAHILDAIDAAHAWIEREHKLYLDKKAKEELDATLGALGKSFGFEEEMSSGKTERFATVNESGKLSIPNQLIKSIVANNPDITGAELVAKVHEAIKEQITDKEFTEKEVSDAISGYGKEVHLSADEVNKDVRRIKQEIRDARGLEDAMAGKGVKRTGLQRDKPTDAHREMQRRIKEEMAKHPVDQAEVEHKWKTSLDKAKSALVNKIKDISKRIDDIKAGRPVELKKVAEKLQYDIEAEVLSKFKDDLQKDLEDIEGKPEMTDEQKLNNAIASAEKSQKEFERRINDKDFAPRSKVKLPDVPGLTEKLEEARDKRDAVRKEYEKQLEASKGPKKTEEQIATERTLSVLEKKIDGLVADINKNDVWQSSKINKVVETAEIKAARENVKLLKEHIANLREQAGTAEQFRIQKWIDRNNKKIESLEEERKLGFPDRPKKPEAPLLNSEQTKVLAEKTRLQHLRDLTIQERELKNRSKFEKFIAEVNKVHRDVLLSSALTVVKLLGYDVHNVLWYKAIQEVLPNVLKGGERHSGGIGSGRFKAKMLAKIYSGSMKKMLADMYQATKTGKSEMALAYGKDAPMPAELSSWVGQFHSALKVPSIRSEFLLSLEKRMEAEFAKNGSGPLSENRKAEIHESALNDAMNNILLGNSYFTDAYSSIISKLGRVPKNEGKSHEVARKAIKAILEFTFPVIKVPTNYVKEIGAHSPLGIAKGLADIALNKGLKNMTPKQIDNVNYLFKAGAIGTGLGVIGFMNPDNITGYDDTKKGIIGGRGMRVGNIDIPKWVLHFPPLEMLSFGATIRHLMDQGKSKDEAVIFATEHILEEIPFNKPNHSQPKDKTQAALNFVGQQIASFIPPDVSHIAKTLDTETGPGWHPMGEDKYRPAKTFFEQFETRIPYLRENVKEKKEAEMDEKIAKEIEAKLKAGKKLTAEEIVKKRRAFAKASTYRNMKHK